MQRVIDQLILSKDDLEGNIKELMLENKIKKEIIDECQDEYRVQLMKEDVEDNEFSMNDFKETIIEINQVVEMLSVANELSKK